MKDDFISSTLQNKPLGRIGTITQVLDYSICESQNAVPLSVTFLQDAAQITLDTLICLLAVIRFIKESLQMYKVTRLIEISRYFRLLTRDGILYCLAYVHTLSFEPFNFPRHQTNDKLSPPACCYIPYSMRWTPQIFHGSIRGK